MSPLSLLMTFPGQTKPLSGNVYNTAILANLANLWYCKPPRVMKVCWVMKMLVGNKDMGWVKKGVYRYGGDEELGGGYWVKK